MGTENLQVRLLGPVDVVRDGVSRPVAGQRRRAVLAILAMHRGEVVDVERIVDLVWGDDAPATAVNTVQRHVSYLRDFLGDKAAIVARTPGYQLDVPVDVDLATNLIDQGTQSPHAIAKAHHLQTAMGLWRGRPLADVGLGWADSEAVRLEQLRQRAGRALIDARIALGEHALVLEELAGLVRQHPFDEELYAQLILALYRSGRQADALAAYQEVRDRLSAELGVDPGKALSDLHGAILRQEASLDLSPGGNPTMVPDVPVPAQLPAGVPVFAGREGELAYLESLRPERTAVVSAVMGTAGVGKTTLAVHWAHRIARLFPDGQLYANLRGFDANGPAVDPSDLLRRFLDALGVPPEQIPTDLDGQISLYRSRLAGRRVLVLLDNVRDSAQARPLLPGAAGCLALVTSRTQLTGLVAEGAHAVNLDLFTREEAVELLTARLGAARVTAEPHAIAAIIDRCARLPLALAVVAARAMTHPHLPLHRLAGELRDLDTLSTDDPASDVRDVLSWSYHALTPPAARLFRLLGLHPGPDATAAAAASLCAQTLSAVRTQLAELARANLIVEHEPGRFASHDLLRVYAAELAAQTDTEPERRAATRRLMDHYLHTAYAADKELDPSRDRDVIGPLLSDVDSGVVVEVPPDHATALAWLTAEHQNLLAAVHHAGATGCDVQTWQLAWIIATFLYWRCHWQDQVAAGNAGVEAAERLGDPVAGAFAHRTVASALSRMGRFDEALGELREALRLSIEAGDLLGQAHAHSFMAHVLQRQGRHADVLHHERQSLELFRLTGKKVNAAGALTGIGWSLAHLGEHEQGLDHCRQALGMLQDLGDAGGEACAWNALGVIHGFLDDQVQAAFCYRHAIRLFASYGDRYREAVTRARLGDALLAAGNTDDARTAWRVALTDLEEFHHPAVAEVRDKLATLGP